MYLHLTLALLACVSFIDSEVVDKSFRSCRVFFYKYTPPQGFPDQGNKAICQLFENRFHFATLHSSQYRIPLYSAYTLDNFTCSPNQPNRRSRWFIEPQLSGPNFVTEMTTEGTLVDTHKRVQAINVDYPNTDFDRGHLNPNFYQCNDSRTATFTLTNAVPQDPCFNQHMWKEMEEIAKNTMQELCSFDGAQRYFITGAIPGENRIPSASRDRDIEGDREREYYRVNVPSAMWTAACCDSSDALRAEDRDKGFSFGYYGDNKPDSFVIPYKVLNLNVILSILYKWDTNTFKLFSDDCYSQSENSKIAAAKLAVPVERKIAESLVHMTEISKSTIPDRKKRLIQSVSTFLRSNKAVYLKNWKFAGADFGLIEKRSDIQNTRDLFASINKTLILRPVRFRQRIGRNGVVFVDSSSENLLENKASVKPAESSEGTIADNVSERNSSLDTSRLIDVTDEYFVVSSVDPTITASGSRCRQNNTCWYNGGELYKWCYIDWSNNWDYCCHKKCGFEPNKDHARCYTNDAEDWAYCSQRSSMVTISAKKCADGHECGLHREKYHWCYTDLNKNWDYCCQPWHVCSEHWCYAGRNNNTDRRPCIF